MKKNKNLSSNKKAIFPKIKIKVLGIGGGGGSIISEAAKSLTKINFTAIDTDFRALKRIKKYVKIFLLGKDTTHGLGTGMNSALAQKIALKEKEKISKILQGQDLVILVSSLGGGVGSGMSPVFAEISERLGNKTLSFFTLPFKFEGQKKALLALDSLDTMKDFLNAQICVSNENIFKILDTAINPEAKNISIQQAFSTSNEILIKNLEELIKIIYKPGLINVDFADLKTILSKKGKLAFLNTIEAAGPKKVEKITQNLFSNLLSSCNLVAERILFNITGGKDLKMLEVEKISKSIFKLNPQAKIVFGISREPNFRDKIKTTLLVIGREKKLKTEQIKPLVKQPKEKKKIKELEGKVKEKEQIKEKKQPKEKQPKEKKQPKAPFRRSAIEIKKAEELAELKKINQEKEWEIPTFLRKKHDKD